MSNDWIFFALLSPAIFAVVNIIDDNLLRGVYRSPHFGAIISGFFGMLPLVCLLFFPLQIASFPIIILGIIAGFLTVIYYLFYFKALDAEYPSVVIALFNLTPIFALLLAFIFLGEGISLNHFIGFTFIFIASTLLSINEFKIKSLKFSKGLLPVIIASFIYAVIGISSKFVYNEVDFISGYVYFSIGMGLGGFFLITTTQEGKKFPQEFNKVFKKWIYIFIGVELIGIAAELTNNLAISKGPVALVKVVEGIQPLYILLFAILLFPFLPKYFREAANGGKIKKIVLISVMLIGLYFINR